MELTHGHYDTFCLATHVPHREGLDVITNVVLHLKDPKTPDGVVERIHCRFALSELIQLADQATTALHAHHRAQIDLHADLVHANQILHGTDDPNRARRAAAAE